MCRAKEGGRPAYMAASIFWGGRLVWVCGAKTRLRRGVSYGAIRRQRSVWDALCCIGGSEGLLKREISRGRDGYTVDTWG